MEILVTEIIIKIFVGVYGDFRRNMDTTQRFFLEKQYYFIKKIQKMKIQNLEVI
jgi:hypothetical protein